MGLESKFLSSEGFFPLSSFPGAVSSKQNPLVQFLILLCLGEEERREREAMQRHPFLPSHHPLFSEPESWQPETVHYINNNFIPSESCEKRGTSQFTQNQIM